MLLTNRKQLWANRVNSIRHKGDVVNFGLSAMGHDTIEEENLIKCAPDIAICYDADTYSFYQS